MEDREDTAFNCQTPSLLQHRLKRQLCQDHLLLCFMNPLLTEQGCLMGDASQAAPEDAPFTPHRSSSSVEKL